MNPKELTAIAQTNFRNNKVKFGIKLQDRMRHMYIIGKSGTGKTTLMENMMISDIRNGRGVAVIDPHGEYAEKMLKFVPEERVQDVVYFNPADTENPIGFNPLERVGEEHYHLVASSVMGVFKKVWPDVWSPRMEYILNNTLLALLEYPGSNLLGIVRMLSDKDYRKKVVDNLKDPVIKSFWQNEFANYTERLASESVASIQNKVGQFVSNPVIRNIIGQTRSTIDMRDVMDNGKILIVNLSQGRIGEDNSALLGNMIITKIQLAAMSRIDTPVEERKEFLLYIDEFQNFSTESFTKILSEARKYGLGIVLAHQYIEQLLESVRAAVFGNVGTMMTFRVGAVDAEFMEKEFMPEFEQNDLVGLANRHIYIKLMVDGMVSRPFSAETLPPQPIPSPHFEDYIIENSRKKYSLPKETVEEKISVEFGGASAEVMDDKIQRRGEKSLREILGEKMKQQQEKEKEKTVKKEVKKEINIEDLRKSIQDSLSKRADEETESESTNNQQPVIDKEEENENKE